MTLDTLKSYLEIDTPSNAQQYDHITSLNAARGDFAIPLKEIRFAPTGGMLLRRYSPPPGHADKVAWEHIKSQIQEWVALIERHEQHNTVSWPQSCLKWAEKHVCSIMVTVISAWVIHYLGWSQG
ncbi:hypothetical protein ACVZYT_004274 [Yersinia enterocolitica]